jgi:D-alanine transaminase
MDDPTTTTDLYLDGRFSRLEDGCIAVEDRGFQFGDGVYEVIRVHNRRLLWLNEHLTRLRQSLAAVGIGGVGSRHPLETILPELVSRSGLVTGTVYLQVTRGSAPREFDPPPGTPPTVLAYTRERPFPSAERILAGISLHPVEDYRWGRCDIKSTNLLAAVMAKEQARLVGCQEVVWIGPNGVVREGGSSNLFVVVGGAMRTHPADRAVLDGVTRQTVLRLARGMGLDVREQAVTLLELAASEEAFVTSTSRDVMPVTAVAGRSIAQGRPGPITLELVQAMRVEVSRIAGAAPPTPLPAAER